MTKIINWQTKETIIEDPNLSIRELVEKAVEDGISLAYADFSGAYLVLADLGSADLRGAKFEGADVRGAYLGGVKINQDQINDLLKALDVKIT